jgi:hypothetical protein
MLNPPLQPKTLLQKVDAFVHQQPLTNAPSYCFTAKHYQHACVSSLPHATLQLEQDGCGSGCPWPMDMLPQAKRTCKTLQ